MKRELDKLPETEKAKKVELVMAENIKKMRDLKNDEMVKKYVDRV